MEDHDQRLKSLIKLFLAELLELFFAKWAKRLDARSPEWLDKEVFADPPEGHRRVLDLLARVPVQPGGPPLPGNVKELLALIHIEVESAERMTVAKEQLWEAYAFLRKKYRLPVLPIAVYLNVGLNGIGVDEFNEAFDDLDVVRFRYLYVGLSALDGLEYLNGQNLLGVGLSSLMKLPGDRAAVLGVEAIERIAQSDLDDQRKYLLAECIEAYLPLDEAGRARFQELIGSSDFRGAKAMNKTTRELALEEGRLKGIQEGLQEGSQRTLAEFLTERFGPLSNSTRVQVRNMSEEEVSRVIRAAIRANSLKDLNLE